MHLIAEASHERLRQLACWAAAVACLVITAPNVRVTAEAGGSISGRVTLTTRMRGVPISTNAYSSRSVTRQQPPASPEMRSVVVYLGDVTLEAPLPIAHAEIRQEHESFSPRVVAVTRGSTVDFPNFDPFFHNVFSLSGAGMFDLGRYKTGRSRSREFTKAGIVKVYCHIHSQMSATILVLNHPFFTTPDAGGQFTIEKVPPGRYKLVGWHERVGEQTSEITVASGRVTNADITLPIEETR
jgi:plastocyanin